MGGKARPRDRDLEDAIIALLAQGKEPDDAYSAIAAGSWPDRDRWSDKRLRKLVGRVDREFQDDLRAEHRVDLALKPARQRGLVLFLGGAAITVGTLLFAMAHGGYFIFAWGALAAGIAALARNARRSRPRQVAPAGDDWPRRRLAEELRGLGIGEDQVAEYLGHALISCTQDELANLRAAAARIQVRSLTWAALVADKKKRAALPARGGA